MNQGKELGCSKGSVKYINVKMDIIFFIHANSKENDILSEDVNPVKTINKQMHGILIQH